jgi:hypothetical protein
MTVFFICMRDSCHMDNGGLHIAINVAIIFLGGGYEQPNR